MAVRCDAFTSRGSQCANRGNVARGGINFCGIHWNMYKNKFDEHDEARAVVLIRNDIEGKAVIGMRRMRERAMMDEIVNDAIARALRNVDNEIRDLDRREPIAQRPVPPPRPEPFRREPLAQRPVPPPRPEPLLEFVSDNQNVHTNAAVKQTTDIIKRVLEIEVPATFKWNMRRCSKTPGEVITDCRLSINASRVMIDKYTSADDIYGLGRGIYGRLLDSVWQYIKNSEDRKTLRTILKSELEDNVGMCQQGNLSRLANVLAGYLEGVGSFESISEVLGREFPKLLDIDNEDERIAQGNKILDRLAVMDADTRKVWIDGLY